MPQNISRFYFSAADYILTLIYPQACEICRQSVERKADGFVCAKCWAQTRLFNGKETLCRKCGAFLLDHASSFETFCRRCPADFYDLAKAIGRYEKALLVSILKLKHTPFVPQTLSNLLFESYLDSEFRGADLLIPVPLSAQRFSERGFNQAELLAASLAEQTGVKLDAISLKRKVHTEKRRAGMDRKSRSESVKNAFEVVSPRLITNRKILLIDDVLTSGATVSNCARALKKAGAEKVYVLTAARAV